MSKDEIESDTGEEENVKKYNALPDTSFNDPHLYTFSLSSRKKSSDLGLIEGQED